MSNLPTDEADEAAESLHAELALQDVIQERDELKALLKIAADALEKIKINAGSGHSVGITHGAGNWRDALEVIHAQSIEALAKIRGAGGEK